MRWRTKSSWLKMGRTGANALARIVLATAFVTMILLVGNAAEACPKHHNTADPIKIERSTPGSAVSAASHVTRAAIPSDGRCCGAGCHSHGFGCSGGCCSMGGPTVDSVGPSFVFPSASINIAIRDQGEGSSLNAPPDYRPPRTF
jgi:hypothetical protein